MFSEVVCNGFFTFHSSLLHALGELGVAVALRLDTSSLGLQVRGVVALVGIHAFRQCVEAHSDGRTVDRSSIDELSLDVEHLGVHRC